MYDVYLETWKGVQKITPTSGQSVQNVEQQGWREVLSPQIEYLRECHL